LSDKFTLHTVVVVVVVGWSEHRQTPTMVLKLEWNSWRFANAHSNLQNLQSA